MSHWQCSCGGTYYITRSVCTMRASYDGANHLSYDTDIRCIRGGSRFYCEECEKDCTEAILEARDNVSVFTTCTNATLE